VEEILKRRGEGLGARQTTKKVSSGTTSARLHHGFSGENYYMEGNHFDFLHQKIFKVTLVVFLSKP